MHAILQTPSGGVNRRRARADNEGQDAETVDDQRARAGQDPDDGGPGVVGTPPPPD